MIARKVLLKLDASIIVDIVAMYSATVVPKTKWRFLNFCISHQFEFVTDALFSLNKPLKSRNYNKKSVGLTQFEKSQKTILK